ncbi:hypothetical protein [Marinobacterium sp. LSUCC0821]|uniref:hypothetical protein n=1 Tax=Marinobacterium sp. LSUCC0821 TaxID=2668067 RepID=UPI00145154C8|nr:hypothetical protein [Marinobacterium sp. LSUCC0821]QJD72177.1 hypothetical protein HH196_10940 [Marinobacterium sp. LSUCC0821]
MNSYIRSFLWQGLNSPDIHDFKIKQYGTDFDSERFLLNSCRSAIYLIARHLKDSGRGRVHVCSYTCDAVIDALNSADCELLYYGLDANYKVEVSKILNEGDGQTDWVLWQCTLGQLGGDCIDINMLSELGFTVVGDLSLSYGSLRNGRPYESYFDYNVVSYECSKAFSVGWGGEVLSGKKTHPLNSSIVKLEPALMTFKKIIQVLFSYRIYNTKSNLIFIIGNFLRKMFVVLNFFLRSEKMSRKRFLGCGMSPRFISYLFRSEKFWLATRKSEYLYKSYISVYKIIIKNNVLTPNVSDKDFLVSPRIAFFIKRDRVECFNNLAHEMNMYFGDWFNSNSCFSNLSISDGDFHTYNISLFDINSVFLERLDEFFTEWESVCVKLP